MDRVRCGVARWNIYCAAELVVPGEDRLEQVTSEPQIQCMNFAAQLAIAVVSNMTITAPYDPSSNKQAYLERTARGETVSPCLNRRIAPVESGPVDVS